MKTKIFAMLIVVLVFCLVSFAQTNSINDAILTTPTKAQATVQSGVTTITDIVILAVDANASTTIPTWVYDAVTFSEDFIETSTFDNYSLDIVLLEDTPGNAFEMPNSYDVPFNGLCGSSPGSPNGHVHNYFNIIGVLADADSRYDFNNYDYNGDGKVPIHFVSIGSKSGGVICDITYTTSDLDSNGNPIEIIVNRQSRGSSGSLLRNVYTHELGHGEFNFPDIDHSGIFLRNHYGLGGFDVMSCGGFNGAPSPYNPFFRAIRGWITPTVISSSNSNFVLEEFQKNQKVYVYQPSQPSGSYGTQRFYISFHDDDPFNNPFYQEYPYANSSVGGVLIWHSTTPSIGLFNPSFSDWRIMPVDIEAAHGKTIWYITENEVINTGVGNPLIGRDKLEIRKVSGKTEIAGPYKDIDKGDGTVFYTPGFGQEFSFKSNPNSNFIVNSSSENYAQSITTGFTVNNIRKEGSTIKANIEINDYTINSNTTLTVGKWYFNESLTIQSGKTLTIPSGAQLVFASGKGIIVDGTLNATSTTFTSSSTWGGIQFRSGSSGILDGCTIENVYTYGGAAISMIGGGSATVKNCTIENNSSSHGISIINTGTSVPYIYNNTIRNNTLSGIYIYNGNAYLRYNNITGPSSSGHAGVNCYYFSTPLFAAPSGGYEEGWNTLQNGYHGLWGNYHCNINAGSSTNGYNNTFSNNTYANVRASSYTTISAKKNWWSPNPPSRVIVDGTSSVDYSPYNQWQDAIATGNSKNSIGENSITSLSSLSQAREFLFQKDYQSAFDIYKQIINSKINEKEVMFAISDLYFLYKAYSIPGVLTLLESIISSKEEVKEYKPLALEVISNLSLYDKSEPDFLLFNTKLREYSMNTIHELHGIVDLFYYHFNKKEFDAALKVIESVSEKFIEEDNVKFAKWLINSELGIESSSTSKFGNGITSAEDNSKPKEFRLFGNYPNPFNPTTKISFSIPVQAQVELEVYDALGRKVAEVVNETLNAGEYEVEFDGSGLASGLYIYKLTSGNSTDSKKMMILK